jgi:uncharacterized protein (TIGR03437 family)
VDGGGIIDTLVSRGFGFGGDGGPAADALMNLPSAIALDASGNLYIADQGNERVRKVSSAGFISTVATADAAAIAADLSGNVYVSDVRRNRVLRIAVDGAVSTLAGTGTCCYSGDGGPADEAQLNRPWGVAADSAGGVFITDSGNNAIRYVYQGSANAFVRLVANGASNLPGPIAPGEIVVIFGSGLGPAQLVAGESSGAVVRFNGIESKLLYASAAQVSAVVPQSITGPAVEITVAYNGQNPGATVSLTSAAPALFTADSSGTGQVRALNQDGTPNSAARPARLGTVVSLFGTGEGSGADLGVVIAGRLAAVTNVAAVTPGVIRVDVEIPAGVPTGSAVPIALVVAGTASPTVTIAIE